MKDSLHEAMARPKRYDNIDGTGEMFLGLVLLAFALIGYAQAVLPENSIWRNNLFGMLALMYGILLPMLGLGFLLQRLVKRRITWPRTGYVAYNVDPKARRTQMLATARNGAIFGGVFGVVFSVLLAIGATHQGALSLARVAYLTLWVPIYAFWVFQMGGHCWWKWLIVFLMASGLIALQFRVDGGFSEFTRVVNLFVGLTWIGSGALTLLLYMRGHHPPSGDPA